jgi:hypothetical protein
MSTPISPLEKMSHIQVVYFGNKHLKNKNVFMELCKTNTHITAMNLIPSSGARADGFLLKRDLKFSFGVQVQQQSFMKAMQPSGCSSFVGGFVETSLGF